MIYYFLSCQSQSPVTFFLQLCILPQQNAEVAKKLKSPGPKLEPRPRPGPKAKEPRPKTHHRFKPAQRPIIGSFLCCILIIHYHLLPSNLISYFLVCQSQSPVTFFLKLCILPQQNAEVAKNLKSPGLSLNAFLMFSLVLFIKKRKALLLISFSNFFTGIYLAHCF